MPSTETPDGRQQAKHGLLRKVVPAPSPRRARSSSNRRTTTGEQQEALFSTNGSQLTSMKGLELVDPREKGFAKRAARLFLRDGYVAVRDVLEPERLEVCRSGCIKVVRRILATDPTGGGNGHPSYVHSSHRYSITGEGAVLSKMGATPEFAYFCDPPVLREVLTEIYGSDDYICNGFGGDFCLPGCVAYQPLHSGTHRRSPPALPSLLVNFVRPAVSDNEFPVAVRALSLSASFAQIWRRRSR